MAYVKIADISDSPENGTGKRIDFEHPVTYFKYSLALFHVDGRHYAIVDKCPKCGGSLSRKNTLHGMYAECSNEECLWHVKTGICKFDRSRSMSTYKVTAEEDGYYINI